MPSFPANPSLPLSQLSVSLSPVLLKLKLSEILTRSLSASVKGGQTRQPRESLQCSRGRHGSDTDDDDDDMDDPGGGGGGFDLRDDVSVVIQDDSEGGGGGAVQLMESPSSASASGSNVIVDDSPLQNQMEKNKECKSFVH